MPLCGGNESRRGGFVRGIFVRGRICERESIVFPNQPWLKV
jgi:hypothetical protein